MLKKYEINALVDIRSTPYSKFVSTFNKEELKHQLKKQNIHYIYMGDMLGARYDNYNLLDTDGIVNFDMVFLEKKFLLGIDRIYNGISKNFNISLMCSELKPIECHRFGMVSRYISSNIKDISIEHISKIQNKDSCDIQNYELISQKNLEKYMIKQYMGIDNNCLKLFNEDDEVLEAYRILNKKIGYNSITKEGDNSDDF